MPPGDNAGMRHRGDTPRCESSKKNQNLTAPQCLTVGMFTGRQNIKILKSCRGALNFTTTTTFLALVEKPLPVAPALSGELHCTGGHSELASQLAGMHVDNRWFPPGADSARKSVVFISSAAFECELQTSCSSPQATGHLPWI